MKGTKNFFLHFNLQKETLKLPSINKLFIVGFSPVLNFSNLINLKTESKMCQSILF